MNNLKYMTHVAYYSFYVRDKVLPVDLYEQFNNVGLDPDLLWAAFDAGFKPGDGDTVIDAFLEWQETDATTEYPTDSVAVFYCDPDAGDCAECAFEPFCTAEAVDPDDYHANYAGEKYACMEDHDGCVMCPYDNECFYERDSEDGPVVIVAWDLNRN